MAVPKETPAARSKAHPKVLVTKVFVRGLKIDAEIGEVILGAAAGRASPEEITLFKSVGVAVEDVVAADLVYRAAVLEDR